MLSAARRLLISLSLFLPALHALTLHNLPQGTPHLYPSCASLAFQLQPSLHRPVTNPGICTRETSRRLKQYRPIHRQRVRVQASGHSALRMSETTQAIATGVGFVIGAGSVLLYTPMIYRIFRRQSAAGLAPSTWLLKLSCYSASNFYNAYNGYPVSSYAEMITLWLQASVMLGSVCYFQKKWWPLATSAAVIAGVTLVASTADPQQVKDIYLPSAQVFASLSGSGAIVPQLWENYKRGGSGEFSPVTASLLTAGNAIRAWTTSELTHDPLLLAGFGLGFTANLSILLQILFFGVVKEVMLSDWIDSGKAKEAEEEEGGREGGGRRC